MTIISEDELEGVRRIGAIVGRCLALMGRAIEPGMTTGELDEIGRLFLDMEGARPAPQLAYGFPGATCISVLPEVAHGIPGGRVIAPGDVVNIDVSAERGGFFADTGASFAVAPVAERIALLCRDGQRALAAGIGVARAGRRLGEIGDAVGDFARRRGYTLIRNLASHGVGRALHEEPAEIATWPVRDRRRIGEGMVFTIEPFLSLGAHYAVEAGDDGWTLEAIPRAPVVQYEHTLIATRRGAEIVTRAA